MGGPEVECFLAWLVSERKVSVSTHRQALSALLFLYRAGLGVELPWIDELGRPKVREQVPACVGTTTFRVK